MMAGNPSWWSMYPLSQQPALLPSSPAIFPPQYALGSSSLPLNSLSEHNQGLPHSWRQLLLGDLSVSGEEDRFGQSHFQYKKLENWDDQILIPSPGISFVADVKKEVSQSSNLHGHGNEEFQAPRHAWSQVMPVSSPGSCVTSPSSHILNFSYNKADGKNQCSECNSTATGGVCKKARAQASSSQPSLKVRKERLGDRITALHQLVSPFGKTDTASVLLEAIGYIRFLQGQIEALSSPYLSTASSSMRNQHPVQGERSCVLPEDPGQDEPKDLRTRGLCLVPVSCTQHVGSENGADYWAPAAIGGGF